MVPAASVSSQVATRPRPMLGVARAVYDTKARFVQACPSCERSLKIRAAYAGKVIACKHCDHRFVPDGPTLYSEALLRIATAMAGAGLWDRPAAPVVAPAPAPAVA